MSSLSKTAALANVISASISDSFLSSLISNLFIRQVVSG